ncbi:hypothetical protein [Cellulomonas sp. WB94]|uniref:hypothetical protein n=1 Tax=Cellulomonas sp. WB94 TaxID=2173174 RepID=UPI0018D5404E|nr:hypothetical protein [Cellulomonas sp. WB94]
MAPHPDRREIVSVVIAADSDTVWAHVREPAKIRRWFGWHDDGIDDEIRRVFVEDARVMESDELASRGGPVRSLLWRGGDVLTVWPATTPTVAHSVLTVSRRAYESFDVFSGLYDDVDERWIASAQQLRFALELHPGADRRTLRAAGLDAGPPGRRLLDRVGLHGVRGVPVGCHFEACRPDGTMLGGTIWHRTEYQVGLRLHGANEPLLIIDHNPTPLRTSNGRVTAVLSTFGTDDETFAAIGQHWARWWGLRAPAYGTDPPPAPDRARLHRMLHRTRSGVLV